MYEKQTTTKGCGGEKMNEDYKVKVVKVGYTSPNFYLDELQQIEDKLGFNIESTAQLKNALCEALGIVQHERPKMSESEKLSNSISKIASAKGISEDQLNKVLAMLKLA